MTSQVPENGGMRMPPPTMKKKAPGFSNPNDIVRKKARANALRNKVLQASRGTAHEQHVAHEQHMQHQKNQFNNNMKSKNPYNT